MPTRFQEMISFSFCVQFYIHRDRFSRVIGGVKEKSDFWGDETRVKDGKEQEETSKKANEFSI